MTFRRSIAVDGRHPFHCIASIKDVQVRGNEGQERFYVKVQYSIYPYEFSDLRSSYWSAMESHIKFHARSPPGWLSYCQL